MGSSVVGMSTYPDTILIVCFAVSVGLTLTPTLCSNVEIVIEAKISEATLKEQYHCRSKSLIYVLIMCSCIMEYTAPCPNELSNA